MDSLRALGLTEGLGIQSQVLLLGNGVYCVYDLTQMSSRAL